MNSFPSAMFSLSYDLNSFRREQNLETFFNIFLLSYNLNSEEKIITELKAFILLYLLFLITSKFQEGSKAILLSLSFLISD